MIVIATCNSCGFEEAFECDTDTGVAKINMKCGNCGQHRAQSSNHVRFPVRWEADEYPTVTDRLFETGETLKDAKDGTG
jgi:transcription elongation factor Elf1